MKWNLRLAAANRGIWTASDLQAVDAEALDRVLSAWLIARSAAAAHRLRRCAG